MAKITIIFCNDLLKTNADSFHPKHLCISKFIIRNTYHLSTNNQPWWHLPASAGGRVKVGSVVVGITCKRVTAGGAADLSAVRGHVTAGCLGSEVVRVVVVTRVSAAAAHVALHVTGAVITWRSCMHTLRCHTLCLKLISVHNAGLWRTYTNMVIALWLHSIRNLDHRNRRAFRSDKNRE